MDEALTNNVTSVTDTIMQCILIVFLGYFCARRGVVTEESMGALQLFTSNFALPSLIFGKLLTINFTDCHIGLIAGVFAAKALIVFVVLFFGLIFSNSVQWNKLGITILFVTMCNDFGIALPILRQVFGQNLADELYLISPISLCILNPIGLYLMEYQQAIDAQKELETFMPSTSAMPEHSKEKQKLAGPSTIRLTLKVVWKTISHPHVFTTILPLLLRTSSTQWIPSSILLTLDRISESFGSLILFILGYHLHRKEKNDDNDSSGSMAAILLSIKKTLVLPILCMILVKQLSKDWKLSSFAFIYGAVPTPPLVTLYASQYNMNTHSISKAVAISSILSLPLIYVGCKSSALALAHFTSDDFLELADILRPSVITTAGINLLCSILIIIFLCLMSQRMAKLPYHFVLCIAICQCFQSLGLIFWHVPTYVLPVYPSFFITMSELACYLFNAFLALSISRSFLSVAEYKRSLTVFGLGFPALTSLALYVLSGPRPSSNMESVGLPIFIYGPPQVIITSCVVAFSISIMVGCVLEIVFQRTGLSSPIKTSEKPGVRHTKKHMLATVTLGGVAVLGFTHSVWKILAPDDKSLLVALEYLTYYSSFSQSTILFIIYNMPSKYYARFERFIYS